MKRHKIEVFSADCPLCRETLQNVRTVVKEKGCGCEVVEQRCAGDTCNRPAQKYNIAAVPTIVIDGKTAHIGKASVTEVQQLL